MRKPPPVHRLAARPLAPLLATLMLLGLGCSAARQRLPSLPDWRIAPSLSSWRELPLVSRLGLGRGEIRGRVVYDPPWSPGTASGRVVVYLEPLATHGGAQAGEATATVRQHAQRFSPAFLAVAVGQSVIFTNEDGIYHRIFSYSGSDAFDTGVLKRGDSAEVDFETPGEVHFYCALHPAESGSLFVTPSAWFATVEATGAYRIADVPPGEYQLRVWSEAAAPTSREVTVRAGVSASVDLPIRVR